MLQEKMDWSSSMADTGNRRRDSRNDRAPREEKQFDERVVSIDRVARVVKGGRRFRFRALVVIGDGKGKIGVGTAKGADVTAAVSKATDVAKKSLVQVHVNESGTIAHEQQARVAGANILLKPASPGTGLIAGGVVRVVLEVAGVKNALSKSIGSSNKINIAYATVDALKAIQPKEKWHRAEVKAPKKAATKGDK
jgi:small subunit ribosomal protein S5